MDRCCICYLGPKLGKLDFDKISNISDDEILEKLKPIYDLIKLVSNDKIMKNKDLIGFIGNMDFVGLHVKPTITKKNK